MGQWISEGLHHYYLVCNYGVTNSRNRKVYTTGIPGSDCKTGCDATYPALCSAHEIYMSELEEMELEYDLAHGIEISVTASASINASSRSKSRRSKSTRAKSTTRPNRKACPRDVHTSFAMAASSAKPKKKTEKPSAHAAAH